MRKIVICSNTSWYLYNFRQGLIKALQSDGYEVVLVAPKDDYSQRLEVLGCEHHHIELNNKGTDPVEDIDLSKQFYKLFKMIEPDIALIYTIKPNIYGGIVAKFLNIPTINVIAGLGTVFLDNRVSSHIARWLYKLAFSGNRVIFENRDDYHEFVKQNLIDSRQAILISGSGIDTDRFKPKSELKQINSTITFLFIARLIRDKGIMEYVEAIRLIRDKYPTVKFKILGSFYFDNPSAISEAELNSWVESGLVEYLGYTDAVLEEIEKADCIVLPSYREGLSRVLLEGASMGKPLITTDVAGCREVVNDGHNGFLVPVKDAISLSKAMEKMIALTPRERDIMGRRGRLKVMSEFDDRIIIKNYLDAINSYFKSPALSRVVK